MKQIEQDNVIQLSNYKTNEELTQEENLNISQNTEIENSEDEYLEADNVVELDALGEQDENSGSESGEDVPPDGDSDIPGAVLEYRKKQYFVAALLAGVGIFASFVFGHLSPMVMLIGTVYYIFIGRHAVKDYREGRICELAAICSGVRASPIKNRSIVTFRAELEDGSFKYYKFFVPGRNAEEQFIVNAPYAIYFSIDNENYLIGSVLI